MFRAYKNFHQIKVQFVNQVTFKVFSCSLKSPFQADNFQLKVTLDADDDESYQLAPSPIKARTNVKLLKPDEIQRCFTRNNFTAQHILIFNQNI